MENEYREIGLSKIHENKITDSIKEEKKELIAAVEEYKENELDLLVEKEKKELASSISLMAKVQFIVLLVNGKFFTYIKNNWKTTIAGFFAGSIYYLYEVLQSGVWLNTRGIITGCIVAGIGTVIKDPNFINKIRSSK